MNLILTTIYLLLVRKTSQMSILDKSGLCDFNRKLQTVSSFTHSQSDIDLGQDVIEFTLLICSLLSGPEENLGHVRDLMHRCCIQCY